MDVKFGKIKPNNHNIFTEASVSTGGENFFMLNSEQNPKQRQKEQQGQQGHGGRINDYDSNILENNAYQTIPDEMFKMEHRIELLETQVSKLSAQISTLEGLGYDIQVNDLKQRKKNLENELLELNKEYSNLCIGAKISGKLSSAVRKNNTGNSNSATFKDFLYKGILAKFSKKINYSQVMKEALNNLESINSSVDELVQMQIPYGETVDRYKQLTACLNKANMIHAQILKSTNGSNIKKLKP